MLVLSLFLSCKPLTSHTYHTTLRNAPHKPTKATTQIKAIYDNTNDQTLSFSLSLSLFLATPSHRTSQPPSPRIPKKNPQHDQRTQSKPRSYITSNRLDSKSTRPLSLLVYLLRAQKAVLNRQRILQSKIYSNNKSYHTAQGPRTSPLHRPKFMLLYFIQSTFSFSQSSIL